MRRTLVRLAPLVCAMSLMLLSSCETLEQEDSAPPQRTAQQSVTRQTASTRTQSSSQQGSGTTRTASFPSPAQRQEAEESAPAAQSAGGTAQEPESAPLPASQTAAEEAAEEEPVRDILNDGEESFDAAADDDAIDSDEAFFMEELPLTDSAAAPSPQAEPTEAFPADSAVATPDVTAQGTAQRTPAATGAGTEPSAPRTDEGAQEAAPLTGTASQAAPALGEEELSYIDTLRNGRQGATDTEAADGGTEAPDYAAVRDGISLTDDTLSFIDTLRGDGTESPYAQDGTADSDARIGTTPAGTTLPGNTSSAQDSTTTDASIQAASGMASGTSGTAVGTTASGMTSTTSGATSGAGTTGGTTTSAGTGSSGTASTAPARTGTTGSSGTTAHGTTTAGTTAQGGTTGVSGGTAATGRTASTQAASSATSGTGTTGGTTAPAGTGSSGTAGTASSGGTQSASAGQGSTSQGGTESRDPQEADSSATVIEAPSPALSQTEPARSFTPSRSVSLRVNEYLEVDYPGTGWVYLGETSSTPLLTYSGRNVSTGDTLFTLQAKQEGTTYLHFYKYDALADTYIDDYLEVSVRGTGASDNRVRAPSYALTVPERLSGSAQAGSAQGSGQESGSGQQQPGTVPGTVTAQASGNGGTDSVPLAAQEQAAGEDSAQTVIQTTESAGAGAGRITAGRSGTGTQSQQQAQGSGDTTSLSADDLLALAQKAYDERRYEDALMYLNDFFEKSAVRLDEGLYLKAQTLEAPSDVRNIRSALETYETLVASYPESRLWEKANQRITYLKRFYFNIR